MALRKHQFLIMKSRKGTEMAMTANTFTHEMGAILIEIFDGDDLVLTLTTELSTGHVAVYFAGKIARSSAEDDLPLDRKAQALADILAFLDVGEDLAEFARNRLSEEFPSIRFGSVDPFP